MQEISAINIQIFPKGFGLNPRVSYLLLLLSDNASVRRDIFSAPAVLSLSVLEIIL